MNTSDTLLIGYDFSHGKDISVAIVGRRTKGTIEIINALYGQKAEELYERLITVGSKCDYDSVSRRALKGGKNGGYL